MLVIHHVVAAFKDFYLLSWMQGPALTNSNFSPSTFSFSPAKKSAILSVQQFCLSARYFYLHSWPNCSRRRVILLEGGNDSSWSLLTLMTDTVFTHQLCSLQKGQFVLDSAHHWSHDETGNLIFTRLQDMLCTLLSGCVYLSVTQALHRPCERERDFMENNGFSVLSMDAHKYLIQSLQI